MRRPTILFLNRVYPPVRGATGRVARDLATSFARENWHVTVISAGPKSDELRDHNVSVMRVRGPARVRGTLSNLFIWVKMLIAGLRAPSQDIIVTMTDPPLTVVMGMILAKFKKSQHIHWCHDLYPDVIPALGFNMPQFIMRTLKKLRVQAMKSCEKIIVCGRCMKERLEEDGIEAHKIIVIPNWPDLELTDDEVMDIHGVTYHDVDPAIARPFDSQLQQNQKFRVLYSGNLGLAHPVHTILKAAEILDPQSKDIEFVFVGEGERFDYIAKFRAQKALHNIRLLPFQPVARLRETLESGDVHLVTMKEEAAGMVVPSKLYSALAVARPTIFIGPLDSEVSKVIMEHESGLIVAPGDHENLVKAILHFRHDGDAWFAAHMGAVNARDKFTPKESIRKWRIQAEETVQSKERRSA